MPRHAPHGGQGRLLAQQIMAPKHGGAPSWLPGAATLLCSAGGACGRRVGAAQAAGTTAQPLAGAGEPGSAQMGAPQSPTTLWLVPSTICGCQDGTGVRMKQRRWRGRLEAHSSAHAAQLPSKPRRLSLLPACCPEDAEVPGNDHGSAAGRSSPAVPAAAAAAAAARRCPPPLLLPPLNCSAGPYRCRAAARWAWREQNANLYNRTRGVCSMTINTASAGRVQCSQQGRRGTGAREGGPEGRRWQKRGQDEIVGVPRRLVFRLNLSFGGGG